MQVTQSAKLANVCYDIRGPVLHEAMRLEAAGHPIVKLNTGNPAAFGFEAPPEPALTIRSGGGSGGGCQTVLRPAGGPPLLLAARVLSRHGMG